MTNGEMIQKVFNCEVCEPIPEEDIIHVIFPDKNDSAIGFDWSWWNMEYKDLTTKNDLGFDCVARQDVERFIEGFINEYTPEEELEFINLELDGLKHLPPATPIRPKGHWIEHPHEAGPNWKYSMYECSECHGWAEDVSDYCPDCGVRMFEP